MPKLPYNPQITENQHFVPSHFLDAWCTNGLLWVSNKEFKIFQEKPQNVAKEKGIYSLEYMTADEFIASFSDIANLAKRLNPELFKLIMDGMVSNLLYREIIEGKLALDDFNRIMSYIGEMKLCTDAQIALLKLIWTIYETSKAPDEIKLFCKKLFIEGMEPFVTRVEHLAYPLIEDLRCGDSAFIQDPGQRESLLLYIAVQMFRIRKFTDIANHYGLITPKTLKLSRIIFVARTLDFLMMNWSNEYFCVVDNITELEFITGDNPLCNLDAHEKPRYLDLFFPISPVKAIFISCKDRISLYPEMRQMTTQYVHKLNQKISAGCTYQIFAAKHETLMAGKYRPSFDPKKAATRIV